MKSIAGPDGGFAAESATITKILIQSDGVPRSKRALDLALASLALLAFAPLIFITAALVYLSSPGPALLYQVRIGRHGRPFVMFKFRTMQVGVDDRRLQEMNTAELCGRLVPGTSDGVFKIEADPRVTRVGRWLRRFSIDELPQLFNVLRGEMSLVGPRPSLPWEVKLYSPEQCRRHDCLPGMTGLWQVSGRNRLSMPEMLALDVLYVATRSLWLDIWILLHTPGAVLFDRSVR